MRYFHMVKHFQKRTYRVKVGKDLAASRTIRYGGSHLKVMVTENEV